MDNFKVLLVDDEKDFVNSLSERLELRDMDTDLAYNGYEALKAIKKGEPAVMVLDLKMPEMDGFEVLRTVKKINPDVQVIILTGHGSEKDKKQAMDMGALAYLQKPVEMNVLVEYLKKGYSVFKSIKQKIDTAFTAATFAEAGEVETAKQIMENDNNKL